MKRCSVCVKQNTTVKTAIDACSKKTDPKISILQILVYKIQPEIMKSKAFTRFNFITKPCSFL